MVALGSGGHRPDPGGTGGAGFRAGLVRAGRAAGGAADGRGRHWPHGATGYLAGRLAGARRALVPGVPAGHPQDAHRHGRRQGDRRGRPAGPRCRAFRERRSPLPEAAARRR